MRKTKSFIGFLSSVLVFVLVAAMALTFASCGKKDTSFKDAASAFSSEDSSSKAPDTASDKGSQVSEVGTGAVQFTFEVVSGSGEKSVFTVKTDKKTVGEALLENGLIEGEAGNPGFYVKKVLGEEADYDKDKAYWAFYTDGQYAMAGVDATEIVAGKVYSLKYEK